MDARVFVGAGLATLRVDRWAAVLPRSVGAPLIAAAEPGWGLRRSSFRILPQNGVGLSEAGGKRTFCEVRCCPKFTTCEAAEGVIIEDR